MQLDVIILGASGYGGGELLRWLSRHPNVASIRGTSRSLGGQSFSVAHPNLRGIFEGNFVAEVAWGELTKSAQPVVFSALPHGELAKILRTLEEKWTAAGFSERVLLIDLSGDFRVPDAAAFHEANGVAHPAPSCSIGSFTVCRSGTARPCPGPNELRVRDVSRQRCKSGCWLSAKWISASSRRRRSRVRAGAGWRPARGRIIPRARMISALTKSSRISTWRKCEWRCGTCR